MWINENWNNCFVYYNYNKNSSVINITLTLAIIQSLSNNKCLSVVIKMFAMSVIIAVIIIDQSVSRKHWLMLTIINNSRATLSSDDLMLN